MEKVKFKILTIFLFILTNIFGQKDTVLIYGNVSDEDCHKSLDNIMIDLIAKHVTKDNTKYVTILYKTRTDTLGNYTIPVHRKDLNSDCYLQFNQDFIAFKKRHTKDTCCFKFDELYTHVWFGESTFENIQGLDTISRIKIDKLLDPQCGELKMPTVLFDENSFEFKNDSTHAIQFLKCLLNKNPSMSIMIKAHCDFNEINKQELSDKRALDIKQRIVNLGINPKRIETVGFADKKPKIQKEQLKKTYSKEQKEMYRAINRRCTINIASWEFKE